MDRRHQLQPGEQRGSDDWTGKKGDTAAKNMGDSRPGTEVTLTEEMVTADRENG
jgi:hypothetical protein